jgi:hypothetical protein
MKRSVFFVLALMIFATSCSYGWRSVVPERLYTSADMQAQGMERFAHREATKHGFRLCYITLSAPKPLDMVDALIVANRAEGVTNLDVESSEFNAYLFQIPRVVVRADLVRTKQRTLPPHEAETKHLAPASTPAPAEPPPATPPAKE